MICTLLHELHSNFSLIGAFCAKKVLSFFLPLFLLIPIFLGYLFGLVTAFLTALFVHVVLYFKKVQHDYWYAYRITLQAMTLALFIKLLLFKISGSWLITLGVVLIITIINFSQKKNEPLPEMKNE